MHSRCEILKPVFGLKVEMKVEKVVGFQRRARASFFELSWETPHLHAHAAAHKEVNDPSTGLLGDRHLTIGTPEAVRTALIV